MLCECGCGQTTGIAKQSESRRGIVAGQHMRFVSGHNGRVFKVHGHARKSSVSPEYRSWGAMHNRCNSPTSRNFNDYGGRGISVCERWKSFELFLEDLGPRPSAKHTLDRIDNDGDYEPSNCRWATVRQQANNKSTTVLLTFNGRTQPMSYWAEEIGLSYDTLNGRLLKGWTVEEALTKPFGARRKKANNVRGA